MFIEKPKSFEKIDSTTNQIRLEGCDISEHPNTKLKLFIDKVEQKGFFRKPRNDVFEAYKVNL
ncbi:hypothetical protein [Faecalibacillus intestinalis]|uniref:hypothetical protein n=1 Tax=Faecalibacillus intestinalis TaxID=1982626 RepID=UPI003995A798